MKIRLGFHYDPELFAADSAAAARVFREMLEHAVEAESLGLDVAWVAERPTAAGSVLPAALPVCAAMAARTRRLRIATALLPLPLHHPLRVAEDSATVDGISNGRFELGVGLGSDPSGLSGYGVAMSDRVARFEEAVSLIRQAWRDGPVRFEGRHFRFSRIEVAPKPVQRPGPPIWIGARIALAQQRAARLGAGLLAAPGASAAVYLRHWQGSDQDPRAARVAVFLPRRARAEETIRVAEVALEDCAGATGQLDLILPTGAPLEQLAILRSHWPSR